jgi:hypothetical protein
MIVQTEVTAMKKLLLVLIASAFLSLSASALATTPPSHSASASCKAQLQASGKANFDAIYKTTGGCISKMSKLTATQRQAVLNAEKTCRTAQTANASAFETKYGTTTKNGKTGSQENAFGKCVSKTASA